MKYKPDLLTLERIALTCQEALKNKPRIFIALSGLPGSGKSTLGGYIRKNGLNTGGGAKFYPYEIAVIDDNVMSLNLFVIRPKIKFKLDNIAQRDNLKPFLRLLPPYVKIVFCIGSSIHRLDKADIFIYLDTKEEVRKTRLLQRGENNKNYLELCAASSVLILPHKFKIIIQ